MPSSSVMLVRTLWAPAGGLVVELDVRGLVSADRRLLVDDRQGVPRRHVVEVLLDDHVARSGEGGVVVADEHRGRGGVAGRVLGPVDEAEDAAVVEVSEPVDLIDDRSGAVEAVGQQRGQLEAHVHPRRPDVEQEVARGRRGVVDVAPHLGERVEVGRARSVEESVPGVGADAGDEREARLRHPAAHGPAQTGEVGEEVADLVLAAGVDREHEEDRRRGQRREDRLRVGRATGVDGLDGGGVVGGVGHPGTVPRG